MAANAVSVAEMLHMHSEKAALAVTVSTLVAVVSVPFMALWLLY